MGTFRRFDSPELLLVPWAVVLVWLLGGWLQAASPEAAAPVEHPQQPRPPFPYSSVPVSFTSGSVRLAGTLTMPPGPGPHPAVVLISGAGAQDRDGTLAGHRRYWVLADFLSRRGLAVLRTDDRGVGESQGDTMSALLADLGDDTRAAIEALAQMPRIDRRRIGLMGASQGSVVAAQVAAGNGDVAFVVLVSPPGLPGEATLAEQRQLIDRAAGVDEETLAETRDLLNEALALRRADLAEEEKRQQLRRVTRRLNQLSAAPAAGLVGSESRLEAQIDVLLSPAMGDQLEQDPRPALAGLQQPVLALWGDLDLQVPPDLHYPVVEQALAAAGNDDVELLRLPGLNHLLQPSPTGLPSEYAEIALTWSPQALATIGDWLQRVAAAEEVEP